MNKKKIMILLALMMIMISLIICGIIVLYCSNMPKENTLTYCLQRIDGNSNWQYELSNNSLLEEKDCKTYDYLGHSYNYWVFEPIGNGEVTIYFNDKECGTIIEEFSFSITYYIDESGTITELSSDNKPEMINIKDNMVGYIKIIIYDFIYCYIVKFIIGVADTFDYFFSLFE